MFFIRIRANPPPENSEFLNFPDFFEHEFRDMMNWRDRVILLELKDEDIHEISIRKWCTNKTLRIRA